jgi:hypothetical protein
MTRPSTVRGSWVLLVVVAAAFAVGAASTILLSAPSSTGSSGPSPLLEITAGSWIITVGSVAILCFVVAAFVLMRMTASSAPVLNRLAVTTLMVVLIAVIFLVTADALGFGPGSGSGNTTVGQNSTSPPPPTGGHNLTGPGGQIVHFPGLPAWVPFVVLIGIALVAVFVALPLIRSYSEDRRSSGRAPATETAALGVREALSQASGQLDIGADPREVILALYAALLTRLQPMVVELDTITPEEIRAWHLERLGVRSDAARTLTRLFEEARYSTHPMGSDSGARAREAVRAALDDLDRRNFPA